jgi:predicted PurR-regulated permease PerM
MTDGTGGSAPEPVVLGGPVSGEPASTDGGALSPGGVALGSAGVGGAGLTATIETAVPLAPENANAPVLRVRRGLPTYSPFRLGFTAAVGVGIAYLIYQALRVGKDSFVLVALSLFLAAGLDPVVRRVETLGLRRGPAVGAVFLATIGALVGIGIAIIPSLASQTTTFVHDLPGYITDLQKNRRIADLDRRFGILDSLKRYVSDSSQPGKVASSLLSIGSSIASSIFELFTLAILTLYFMAYLRDITAFVYRITPLSRRSRVTAIGDRVVHQIGLYVAGSSALALLAGIVSFGFLSVLDVPDPLALAFLITVLNLAPVIGSGLAIVIVCTVVFLDSIPKGIAAVVFFAVYIVVQRLLLTPRLLDKEVRISPAAAVVGVLAGYTTLGFVGFIVAIPTVAVVTLLMREIVLPRQAAR